MRSEKEKRMVFEVNINGVTSLLVIGKGKITPFVV